MAGLAGYASGGIVGGILLYAALNASSPALPSVSPPHRPDVNRFTGRWQVPQRSPQQWLSCLIRRPDDVPYRQATQLDACLSRVTYVRPCLSLAMKCYPLISAGTEQARKPRVDTLLACNLSSAVALLLHAAMPTALDDCRLLPMVVLSCLLPLCCLLLNMPPCSQCHENSRSDTSMVCIAVSDLKLRQGCLQAASTD